MAKGGATIELTQESIRHFDRQIEKLSNRSVEAAVFGFAKLLQNAKTLAQNKLKADKHIDTSRLRNSIYIKTGSDVSIRNNNKRYSDNNGKSYDADFNVNLKKTEVAIGSNVDYANKIEVQYDSFLYWGVKNTNPDEMGREISKRLLNIRQ